MPRQSRKTLYKPHVGKIQGKSKEEKLLENKDERRATFYSQE